MTDLSRAAVRDAVGYFDSWLAFRQRYSRIPGVQAAVLHGDEILLSAAYGHADVEAGVELTPRHLFRIASHSKTFTATAVLQLAEQGTLRLDDAARRWLPFLDGAPLSSVTVRELLGHSGGVVRDGHDGDFWQLYREFPDEATLRKIATDGADIIPPNERFKYSNIGYSLLGSIIAAASGQDYNTYVRRHIVDRLSLADTGPEYDPARAGEYARGYTSLAYADRRIPVDHVDTAAMSAATGFYSTAQDAVRYFSAHFHGDDRLLSDASKRLMQRAEWQVDGSDGEYGLGLDRAEIGGRRVFGHGGGYPGHITKTYFDPEAKLAVSVLTNAIDGPAEPLASGLIRMVNLAVESSGGNGDERRSDVDLDRFTGRFATMWGVQDVVRLGRRLYLFRPVADDPTQPTTKLDVVDDSTLRVVGGIGFGSYGETVRYEFSGAEVVSVRGGSATTAYPIERITAAVATQERVSVGDPLR
ncbi:serine hydrolase domain-containing protein [Phytoactinopolyspora halotolerans]|uniref:Beta-lactamase family protein n=1 Tax=Phytoactinopolyspora halotolerans TaxID=1981512 RepID=A0A6L9S1V4_9ACTN|nr:serine hydrolase domain-containing protein [Phytoactinopolyspora halotolerans]NED99195.1 beta-lactamase family protein [Phytoactinopolyspora halotolerans]